MKILLGQVFVSLRCCTVGTCGWEKIDFGGLTLYILLYQRKTICIVPLSLTNSLLNTMCEVCHKTKREKNNNQRCFTHVHFMLACRATCDKNALARLIVSVVPGYQTAFLSHTAYRNVKVAYFSFDGLRYQYNPFDHRRAVRPSIDGFNKTPDKLYIYWKLNNYRL